MGPIGMQEMIALFVIALLLFGPKKLPELGRTLGKALSEFRRAKNELKATLESHMNEIEKETRIDTGINNASTSYSYPYDDYGQQDYSYEEPTAQVEQSAEPERQLNSPVTEPILNGVPLDQTGSGNGHTAIADTVPRSNGVRPVTSPVEKEHHG